MEPVFPKDSRQQCEPDRVNDSGSINSHSESSRTNTPHGPSALAPEAQVLTFSCNRSPPHLP